MVEFFDSVINSIVWTVIHVGPIVAAVLIVIFIYALTYFAIVAGFDSTGPLIFIVVALPWLVVFLQFHQFESVSGLFASPYPAVWVVNGGSVLAVFAHLSAVVFGLGCLTKMLTKMGIVRYRKRHPKMEKPGVTWLRQRDRSGM